MSSASRAVLIIIVVVAACTQFVWADDPANLKFKADKPGFFSFDTGVLKGVLRADGQSQGIYTLTHIPTGTELAYGGGNPGILSFYRVFTTNHRFEGSPRHWPTQSRLCSDGGVELTWPATEARPFDLAATFRLADPETIDVETRVRAKKTLDDFEVFLSGYFSKGFEAAVYVKPARHSGGGDGVLLPVRRNPLIEGCYLMFPRDLAATQLIFDGRWTYPPNPVQWAVSRHLAAPLAVRRNTKRNVSIIWMAPKPDCFAVSCPYDADPPDGVAGHASLYFSLFGKSIPAGSTSTASVIMRVLPETTDEAVMDAYQKCKGE